MQGEVMKDKKSLLVVDDELDFLAVIKRILEARGFEVETSPSAGDAISMAKERFYNAAILDISLPDNDGTELLSMLLEMHPDMVAIMLTGHSSTQNAMQSLNRGAFAYLEKPLDPEHLLSVLDQGLEKQRLVFENRKLMQELEQRNRNTSILLDVSQSVSKTLDLPQIIDTALKKVAESMSVDAGYVYLLENNRLVMAGHCGFSPEVMAAMEQVAGDGIVMRIFKESRPVVIKRLAADSEPGLAALAAEGYQSYAGVPLNIVGESIGVMGVATHTERQFTSREVSLVSAIGKEISIAVQNSQLYEEASSARALRELDTMRTEFLANISHELRTPLAVIKGSASSLLQPDVNFDEQAWRDFLRSIDKDADRLSRLVEDLLVMSRLESGALEIRKERHSLPDVVKSVKDRLDNVAVAHEIKIDIPKDLPDVAVDSGRIGEVLSNLVENATKCSEEGTCITVSASPNGGKEVVISVTDEGAGIPRELHEKVFNRFYQMENHRNGNRKGTGLGLSICRGIVEAHGGRIWVDSKEGKGARFSFSVPIN